MLAGLDERDITDEQDQRFHASAATTTKLVLVLISITPRGMQFLGCAQFLSGFAPLPAPSQPRHHA